MSNKIHEQLKLQAQERLKSVAPRFIPSNARRYKYVVHTNCMAYNNLGLPSDPSPAEGIVVSNESPWVIVREKPTSFAVFHESMFNAVPDEGAKVRVEAYARRDFDGRRLDAPREDPAHPGVKTYVIGETRSPLPIAKPQCHELAEMVKAIETIKAPDGLRCLSHMLVDAKARNFSVVDPGPGDDIIATPPTIRCEVSSNKYQGVLEIIYQRGHDLYEIRTATETAEQLDFETGLGEALTRLIDDGAWRYAKVAILKPSPKAKIPAVLVERVAESAAASRARP